MDFMEICNMAVTAFGKRLAELRKVAEMSQPAFAKASGVPLPTIRDLEQGRREPTWSTLLALADGLGVSLDEFREKPKKRR